MLLKTKEAYAFWLKIYKDIPKTERFGIGKRIEDAFLFILETIFTASYLPPEQKIILLSRGISKLDILKFFLQLLWENRLLSNQNNAQLTERLGEIGRQLGGWKKGLQTKTPRP
ncbi:MAG: four helix bundle protein [bacterium]|nr:four helix bundle protein [bacterium]